MFPQFNHVAGRSCLTQEGFLKFLFSIFSPTIEMPCQRAPIGVFGLFFLSSSAQASLPPCVQVACRVWYLLLLAMRQHISWQPWLLVWTFFPLGREGMKKESHHMASLWWLEINCNRQQNFYSSTCSLNFLRSKAMLVALTVFLCFSSSYRCGKLFDCLQLGHDFAPA